MVVSNHCSGVARILKLPGHRNCTLAKAARSGADELARSAEKKNLAFIFQLPGWALMAPSWLAGEPGAVQNWLFSCDHAACTVDKI